MTDLFPDPEKCRQRNRLAARRDMVDSAPLAFLSEPPETRTTTARGFLPASEEEALERINALAGGGEPLTAKDVYIHYAEAANSNYISDRFMFLAPSTLLNIARDAETGVAFMNSHRTGGLSRPSELPFGRTFAGRYEFQDTEGQAGQRATLGFYMLRGVKPNGDGGPSTDDLHAMIEAGTLFDVSVGLRGGYATCDLCGNDLDAVDREGAYLCKHLPGTHHRMSREEVAAQKGRGVKNGIATYSYADGRLGEMSAVYDGAVPGAGFRKGLSLARQRALSTIELGEARSAYASLLQKGDLDMDGVIEAINANFDSLFDKMKKTFSIRTDEPAAVEPVDMRPVISGNTVDPLIQGGVILSSTPDQNLAAELEKERSERAAAEARLAALEVKARRQEINEQLSAMRWSEGKSQKSLSPASRNGWVEFLAGLDDEPRQTALSLLAETQTVHLGEVGFSQPETGAIALSAEDEAFVAREAEQYGLPVDEVRKRFAEAMEKRSKS